MLEIVGYAYQSSNNNKSAGDSSQFNIYPSLTRTTTYYIRVKYKDACCHFYYSNTGYTSSFNLPPATVIQIINTTDLTSKFCIRRALMITEVNVPNADQSALQLKYTISEYQVLSPIDGTVTWILPQFVVTQGSD